MSQLALIEKASAALIALGFQPKNGAVFHKTRMPGSGDKCSRLEYSKNAAITAAVYGYTVIVYLTTAQNNVLPLLHVPTGDLNGLQAKIEALKAEGKLD